MTLRHEKLDVYRLSIGYVAWVYEKTEALADRMAAMPSRLGGRKHQVQKNHPAYGETDASDPDPDSDFDLDEHDNEPQTMHSRRRLTATLNATL